MPSISCLSLLTTLLAATMLSGCASTPPRADWRAQDADAQRSAARDAVVEIAELPAAIRSADNDLVILDVRPEEEYAAGHLPGAVRVDYDEWTALSFAGDTDLENTRAWRSRIGRLGIDADDTVLIYDGGQMTRAARVWFILQHFGAAEARVVNGGFPLIEEAANAGTLSLTSAPSSPRRATFAPVAPNDGAIARIGRSQLRDAVEAREVQILDTRTVEEFRGLKVGKNPRGGHLPTARNLPHTELLDDRGRLKPAGELAAMLDAAGFVKGRPIVTHCQSGGRASLAALAAARAGYGPVVNYYASFGDWASDASCPVVAAN